MTVDTLPVVHVSDTFGLVPRIRCITALLHLTADGRPRLSFLL